MSTRSDAPRVWYMPGHPEGRFAVEVERGAPMGKVPERRVRAAIGRAIRRGEREGTASYAARSWHWRVLTEIEPEIPYPDP